MTPSELKYQIEQAGTEPHFFTRKTMQFFGDTMRNYGVCSALVVSYYDDAGVYVPEGVTVEAWELFRKRPVKHGLFSSAWFSKKTFKRVFPKER